MREILFPQNKTNAAFDLIHAAKVLERRGKLRRKSCKHL
jgi:hypothetical protein